MSERITTPGDAPPPPAAPTPRPGPGPGSIKAIAVTAGVIAGLAAWAGGESIRGRFQPVETTAMGPEANQEAKLIVAGLEREASMAFDILGGSLGLAMGLAGGLARRSARSMVAGGVVGLGLGIGAAAAASAILLPIAGEYRAELNEGLLLPLLLLGGIWSAIGLAAGLGYGVGRGGRDRMLLGATGGLVGAAVATGLFLILGAVAFPLSQASSPIPATAEARCVARLAVTILTALGAALMIEGSPIARPDTPQSHA